MLRIQDLMNQTRTASGLLNVRIPTPVADAIDKLAKDTGATKTDVIVALLNEGLSGAKATFADMTPKKRAAKGKQ